MWTAQPLKRRDIACLKCSRRELQNNSRRNFEKLPASLSTARAQAVLRAPHGESSIDGAAVVDPATSIPMNKIRGVKCQWVARRNQSSASLDLDTHITSAIVAEVSTL